MATSVAQDDPPLKSPNWSRLRVSTPSWFYPFKGAYYFASHRFLWPLLQTRLIPCFLLSLFVLGNLFIWTYLPQVAFLVLFHRMASAWVNGAFLVLGEGAAIIALVFEALLSDETQVDIFDAVLVNEGLEDLVAKGREVRPAVEGEVQTADPRLRLGKYSIRKEYSPFSFRQIIELILCLPFNFIPFVGVPIFLLLTGARYGPFQHWHYFKLSGLTKKERKVQEKRRRLSYAWFGTVALVLQLIPGLNMLFLLTTTAGSALWCANIEKGKRALIAEGTGPEYGDDPV